MAARVARHKAVFITYEIWDQHGQLFERSDIPVGYVHGVRGPLIEKVERALEGHAVGDRIQVQVTPSEGFGEYRPELTFTDDIDNVPEELRRLGAQVTFENDKGETLEMVVSRIENGKLTVDGNHPLAGQTVTFKVSVADVRDATAEEIASGMPDSAAPGAPHIH